MYGKGKSVRVSRCCHGEAAGSAAAGWDAEELMRIADEICIVKYSGYFSLCACTR